MSSKLTYSSAELREMAAKAIAKGQVEAAIALRQNAKDTEEEEGNRGGRSLTPSPVLD